ncbi:MAG: hypothetical protein ACJ748_09275, partial [Flavisolibacter sp.]
MEVHLVNQYSQFEEEVHNIKGLFDSLKKDGRVYIATQVNCYGFLNNELDVLVLGELDRKEGNGFRIDVNGKFFWVNSFCFFLKIVEVNNRKVEKVLDHINLINADASIINLSSFANQLGSNAEKYLAGITGYSLICAPIIFLKNNKPGTSFLLQDSVISGKLNLLSIFKILYYQRKAKKINTNIYASFDKNWDCNIEIIQSAIKIYNEEMQSQGLLTKRKVDWITKKQLKGQLYNQQIGNVALIFRGPAGSGKTMKMISIADDLYKYQRMSLIFLTYNQSLVKDLVRLAVLAGMQDKIEKPSLTIQSLHSFIYKISRQLYILPILSIERRDQLSKELSNQIEAFGELLNSNLIQNKIVIKSIQNIIENQVGDKVQKQKFYSIYEYLKRHERETELHVIKLKDHLHAFKNERLELLIKLYEDDLFLAEYDNII